MPAARANRLRGTRAPAGATAPRQGDRLLFQVPPLWPGITWGNDSRCSCSWAFKDGEMQVKARSAACPVHVVRRVPEPEPEPERMLAPGESPWPAVRELIAVLAEALDAADSRPEAKCGTASGSKRHRREGTETCAACREFNRNRMRAARRPKVRRRRHRKVPGTAGVAEAA